MSQTGNVDTILGNYRVSKSIGEGTFGKVKLGIHTITEEKVAIKTLQKEKIIEQSDIERVTREICILKVLRHPNIIQLYEIIETKTDIHLIMEYAEGGELFDYIVKKKRLDETEAAKFMHQILSGVEYIHKNGIVHRDLKPENLLLDHNKNVKIVDFGLSNQYKPNQRLKTACGSPCYAAPEMIAGKRYECLNVDIWSCGIILYAMLCGYLPFEDPNTNKLYKKIIAGDFDMPKILSTDAKEIIKCILNVNPETRYKPAQIRRSKWFNQSGYKCEQSGIIVGKDQIEPNEQIIREMERYNVDPVQARTYVINNRHNHTTAFYYLLHIKLSREGKLQPPASNSLAEKSKGPSPNELRTDVQVPERDSAPNSTVSPVTEQKKSSREKNGREESPLIYRPDKKPEYYVPYGKKANKDSSAKNNDSMNVSNIISSLVEANKNKLISKTNTTANKKNDHFDKLQEFKLFPNKKNSSIYEPSSGSKVSTSRSKYDDKSFDFSHGKNSHSQHSAEHSTRFGSNIKTSTHYGSSSQQKVKGSFAFEGGSKDSVKQETLVENKKRDEWSDELGQITSKIDRQIMELRKNSTNTAQKQPTSVNRSKEVALGDGHRGYISPATNRKRSEGSSSSMSGSWFNQSAKEHASQSHNNSMQMSHPVNRTVSTTQPGTQANSGTTQIKVHSGPFNAQCLFMDSANSLMSKITQYLSQSGIRFSEPEPYSLLMADGDRVSIEAIQGMAGLHLIKFGNSSTTNVQFNQALLDVLSH